MPTDVRDEIRRLIEERNPEAALFAAAFYLQEADRILAEAAHQYSEAQRAAGHVDRDRAEVAAERQRLDCDVRELERERHELDQRARMLDQAYASLEARGATAAAKVRELQEKTRKPGVESAPAPESVDIGPLTLRPNPTKARTPDEFRRLLAEFRIWSGNRSLRHIAEASGGRISASAVGNLLRGRNLPDRLEVVDAFVIGCGGATEDRAQFASAWRRLCMTSLDTTLPDLYPDSSRNEVKP